MQGSQTPPISNSGTPEARLRGDRFVDALTGLLAMVILGLLTGLVLSRKGNLAWDDADYLRRGLTNARFAERAGPLMVVPRAIDRLLLEQPKPPWLVGWIEFGVHAIGRRNVEMLILFSSVVPYAFLMAGVFFIGRRLQGPWGGLFALVCLASSPLSLAFGGKVMVETYLALWVLLLYGLTALLLVAPSRKKALALGFVVGLAFLTKLTIALFLPGPFIYGCACAIRGRARSRLIFKRLLLASLVCLAVAGPWYVKNARQAVKFAIFSSKYNEIAAGRPDRVPITQRVAGLANDLAGWPLITLISVSAIATTFFWRKGTRESPTASGRESDAQQYFTWTAWIGTVIAAGILLYPAYFDTRFLVPIWPVLAVAVGSRVGSLFTRLPAVPRSVLGAGFAASVMLASAAVVREPLFPTYWKTTGLIDDLVERFGVSNIMNVGNCAAWNVCKTGLMNELREQPGNCFVLYDLTKVPEARALHLLEQADAVMVLGQSDLPEGMLQSAPGLNRGYGAVVERLERDVRFSRIAAPASNGLPNLSVYVRRSRFAQAQEMSKFDSGRRR